MRKDHHRTVWVRLGADITLTEQEYLECKNDPEKVSQKLREAALRGDYTLSGESYCPDEIALDLELVDRLSYMGEINFTI